MEEILDIKPERIERDFKTLETFTDPTALWSRRAFSPEYKEARAWLSEQFRLAGLEVFNDAASNLIGRRGGDGNQVFMMGSHTDTVKSGGRFDGIVGVLGALEIARCLQDSDINLALPLEIVDFTCEEPTVNLSPLGSRIMAGDVVQNNLKGVVTPFGDTVFDAIDALGGDSSSILKARRISGQIAGYLELHIEQGAVLEKEGLAAGIVTTIAAPCRGRVQFFGSADHAGATPMPDRKDALLGAAELVIAIEKIVTSTGMVDENVGTVGWLNVSPNMINVIPGQVDMSVEVRSTDIESLVISRKSIEDEVVNISERRGLKSNLTWDHLEDPVPLPSYMQDIVKSAFSDLGVPIRQLPSRASHDAARIAPITPAGMVFIRCLEGKSHCPEEWASMDDIVLGTRLLGQSLFRLNENFLNSKKG
jgi:N-carbamoyl-L-amino-acid hydrolase